MHILMHTNLTMVRRTAGLQTVFLDSMFLATPEVENVA
jgi:hypothetical protein